MMCFPLFVVIRKLSFWLASRLAISISSPPPNREFVTTFGEAVPAVPVPWTAAAEAPAAAGEDSAVTAAAEDPAVVTAAPAAAAGPSVAVPVVPEVAVTFPASAAPSAAGAVPTSAETVSAAAAPVGPTTPLSA